MRVKLDRIAWRRWLVVLIGASLLGLAVAAVRYREEREVHGLLRQRSPEAYAEAVERAGSFRGRLFYNLGNLYFERGQAQHSAAAVRAALSYYRESLRLDPEFLEAKKNYEVAQRFLDGLVPPREPREPRPPDRARSSQMPLKPTDI